MLPRYRTRWLTHLSLDGERWVFIPSLARNHHERVRPEPGSAARNHHERVRPEPGSAARTNKRAAQWHYPLRTAIVREYD